MIYLATITLTRREYDGDGGPRKHPKPEVLHRLVEAESGEAAKVLCRLTYDIDDPYGTSCYADVVIHDTITEASAKAVQRFRGL